MCNYLRTVLITTAIFAISCLAPRQGCAALYTLSKVGDGIFAAVAQSGSKAASNALIIIGRYQVILAGAHFSTEGISELSSEVAKLTPLPVRSLILTHHHRGYSFVDFDIPSSIELIMSWQTWQAMNSERRDLKNNITFFKSNVTLVRDNVTIVLTNTDNGHTTGDVFIYLPASMVLFTSDLVFNSVIGNMGDSGNLRDWVLTLEMLDQLGAATVVPGLGPPGSSTIIGNFSEFCRDFLTEVIRLRSANRTLAQAKKEFNLPAKYTRLPGYTTFMTTNLERAYSDPSIQ